MYLVIVSFVIGGKEMGILCWVQWFGISRNTIILLTKMVNCTILKIEQLSVNKLIRDTSEIYIERVYSKIAINFCIEISQK